MLYDAGNRYLTGSSADAETVRHVSRQMEITATEVQNSTIYILHWLSSVDFGIARYWLKNVTIITQLLKYMDDI